MVGPLCANRYSIASSGREQQRWNFKAECFARPQLNQGLAWLVAGTVALCLEHSLGHSAARPSSGNTSCKLSIVPCAASPGTSRPRFPFAPQHKAFAHPVRTMLGGRFLSLEVSCRL